MRRFLLIISLVYIIPAFFLPAISDVALFETVGIHIAMRDDFYAFDRPTHGTFPFLPLMTWIYGLFHMLSVYTGINFVVFVRLFVILFVVLTTILIRKFGRNPWLLILNPITFLVVVLHGQVDAVLIFFVLAAIYNFEKPTKSSIALALSLLVKNWSIIFAPLFLIQRQKLSHLLLGIIGFALTIGFFLLLHIRWFHSKPELFLETFTSHLGGSPGYFGYTAILNVLGFDSFAQFLDNETTIILGAAFLAAYFISFVKKLNLVKSALLVVLTFLVFTPGWGLQYTFWILPFAIVAGESRKIIIYTLLATPYLSLAYLFLILKSDLQLAPIILGLPLWIFFVWWFYKIARS